ncbi:MAG: hypothetical protein COV46_03950 [Deltaproteobacteria bacterium CG11_big_fil_rev_8_21_14_0_20_49_13]|nr:MAG: hypothetical protein COV46_03950 [Deltaproteobacteria bacterium CG11_big_fil_rev_8_21_14_0_20_49_13]
MEMESAKNRQDIVAILMASFGTKTTAQFGPKVEEKVYINSNHDGISKDECVRIIRENISISGDELSNLADIHPAWIVKALENESPKIIGIILRWLPSRHVRYILEHLPKRVKMSLPKLVESFAVPTQILKLIREGFEKKFAIQSSSDRFEIRAFDDLARLRSEDLDVLFKDIGIQELAMAFQNLDESGVKVLLNRMPIRSARSLQQRIRDVEGKDTALLKDARFTILEVAFDQEDIDKLLLETGLAAFSKAMKGPDLFTLLQMKLDPTISYIFKRFVEAHVGVNKLAEKRQALIMERFSILSKAGLISEI